MDVKTPPEAFYPMLRTFLEAGQPMVQRRMFDMYQVLMRNTTGQPSENQGVPEAYRNLIEAIFKPFINSDTLKCNQNLLRDPTQLNNVRVGVWRNIKKITECDQVNVIYKTIAATEPNEGISFYINDLNIIEGTERFAYKISNFNVKLSDKSTVTVVIPMKHIYLTIDGAKAAMQSKTNFEDNKNALTVDLVMNYIVEMEFRRILKSLVASIYKESIFLNFAKQVFRTTNEILKIPPEKWDDEARPTIESFIEKSVDIDTNKNFSFKDIVDCMVNGKLDRINPYSFMDLFEIRPKELEFVVDLYVKSAVQRENAVTTIPNYYALNFDADQYYDIESRVSASAVYLTKLQYCIIALLISTDGSIRESMRSEWCKVMANMSGIITNFSKVSYVSNNKKWITKEIDAQIKFLNGLGENLIRLKQIRKVL